MTCFLLLLTALPLTTHSAYADADRPNIILCMADDQGWGDTAYNGHPLLKTPNLDAMAAANLRFDHFYAAAPVCSPTRASVMTGRHPNRSAVFSWGRPLRPQEITIAERLKAAGYTTGHFGKWHLGSVIEGSPVNPSAQGFDSWLSAPNFYDNDPILSREGRAVQTQGESSMVAMDAAIDFIREQSADKKPFLAVVWFGSPHGPHAAAEEDRALYEGEKNADWMGEITGIDRAMGKLRAELRDLGITENTLVWYTSDNGGLKVESSGGRGKKGQIYEGGLRVPAIIEWPAKIKEPRISNRPSNTADIYPTLLELLGIEPEDQPVLDGVSLADTIDGTSDEREHPMGFWHFGVGGISTPSAVWMAELLEAQQQGKPYGDDARLFMDAGEIKTSYPAETFQGHAAWLDYPWKLHRIAQKKGDDKFELYNLASDPMETTDLSADEPERVRQMAEQLDAWRKSVIDSLNGEDY